MNHVAKQNQPRDSLNARPPEPVSKGMIRVVATSRIEALLWKLRINLLFIGADITTRQ